jgi:hypothetical protein
MDHNRRVGGRAYPFDGFVLGLLGLSSTPAERHAERNLD